MNDSERAAKLLTQREDGITVYSGFVSLKKRMIFRAALIALSLVLYDSTNGSPVFILLIGFILGMYVQDFSWFQAVSKSWGFTKSIINWSEVERIANKNS